jgi:hypothetical protein
VAIRSRSVLLKAVEPKLDAPGCVAMYNRGLRVSAGRPLKATARWTLPHWLKAFWKSIIVFMLRSDFHRGTVEIEICPLLEQTPGRNAL